MTLAYYLGARIGFILQSPLVPQSILWLPNSVLLAALLIEPVRRWPLYLLAGLPAQLLVGWEVHGPVLPMSLLYVTNCTDAALGAGIVRALSHGRPRLDGLQRLFVFLVFGATLAPAMVSFADAAITVLTGWSSDYWLSFSTRTRANVLTNVILVPAVVSVAAGGWSPLGNAPARRYAEGFALIGGLLVTAAIVFSAHADSWGLHALLYAPLPFLLWAALRFGPGMTGAALLVLALVSGWLAVRGFGAFSAQEPSQNVASLQFFLLAISVPLLCLAAVVQERERTSTALLESRRALRLSVDRIRDLAGRLLAAQEQERTRIARELHDGVNQQLAAVSIGLSGLKRRLVSDAPLRDEVARLQQQTLALVEGIRDLSHELHPSVLQHAGLVAAVRGACLEFGRQHAIEVDVRASGELGRVPDDVALCLYRVVQEALRNAARHAGARRVVVTLTADTAQLELVVADDGRGFDVADVRRRGGLGLVSIDERARIVRGSARIDSAPGRGTRLWVRVPRGGGDQHGSADGIARG